MHQLTGVLAIATQAHTLTQFISPNFAVYVPVCISAAQLVGNLCCSFNVAFFGRKTLLLVGSLGLCFIQIGVGVLFIYFKNYDKAGMVVDILLGGFMFWFGFILDPAVRLYVPEIVPAKALSYISLTTWVCATAVLIFTPLAAQDLGYQYVFLFFGVISFILWIVNAILVLETKGLTKEQIIDKFSVY